MSATRRSSERGCSSTTRSGPPARQAAERLTKDPAFKKQQRDRRQWDSDAERYSRQKLPEFEALRDQGRDIKDHVLEHLDFYLEEFEARKDEWLPNVEDQAYVKSLMVSCTETGKYAAWIAPPKKGINQQGTDFEYVRL